MVNFYNYQVWQDNYDGTSTCAATCYKYSIDKPLCPSIEVFLYTINPFIN
mgnify:CR=1 FL=1